MARGGIPEAPDLALSGGGSAPIDMLCDIPACGMVAPNL
jgi:hypothetical protein